MPRILRWAWLGLVLAALLTRFLALGAAPMLPDEIDGALGALDAARVGVWPATTGSPLLLVGNAFLFLLLGPGEAVARLLPALAGAGVVLLPFLWRRRLGDTGALVASGLLLVSSLALFAARRVDGASLATLAVGLLATAALRSNAPSRSGLWMVAGAVAVGLLSGPAFYDLLLTGVLILILAHGLQGVRALASGWRLALVAGLAAALLISLAFGFRWSGWAGIADGAAAWLAGWGQARPPGIPPLAMVGLYEPLLLALVVATAVIWGTGQQSPLLLSLLLWGVLVILLNALRPGSTPATLSAAVLPLALAGGWVVGSLLTSIPAESRRWTGLHTLAAFIFWLPALASLAHVAGQPANFPPALLLLGAGVLVVLQVLLTVFSALHLTTSYVWRGALLGFCGALLLVQMSFAIGLAFVRPASPVEPAVSETASPDLDHLVEMLRDLAIQQATRWDALNVVILDRDPELSALLRWHLRDFDELQVRADWPEDPASAVIAPEAAGSLEPGDPGAWRGMSFVALASHTGGIPPCQSAPYHCSDALKWYLYRASPTLPTIEEAILWQNQDRAMW